MPKEVSGVQGPRILILGAGQYHRQVYELLRDEGFYLIGVDRDKDAPAASAADEFYAVDYSNEKAILALSKKLSLDGVMPLNDFGTRPAALLSHELSLPGMSYRTADTANDKGLMRECWKSAGLPNPKFKVIATIEELREALKEIGLPAVLKPTDCGGSGRGISVIRGIDDIAWAYNFAEPYVKNGRFIVEEFIDGTEVTVETFSIAGNVRILAMSDKVKPELRTRVATSLNYPADIVSEELRQVERVAREAVDAIGIIDGPAHLELILTEKGPVLLEIGARGGGGHIFHTIIQAVSEFNAPVQYARYLTNQSVSFAPVDPKGAVYRFFTSEPGVLQNVSGVETARQIPGVLDIGIAKKPGDHIGQLENSLDRVGFVVTTASTREGAISIADKVEHEITFDVK